MARADKATLRLTIGLGLSVFVAYGLGLQAPYVVCIMALFVLCKSGPPLSMVKSAAIAAVFAALVAAGVLMVPLLENYAAAGVLLTAVLLFGLFYQGRLRANPLTTVLVLAFALIPVVGVQEQALIGVLALTLAVGVVVGAATSAASNAIVPDQPATSAPAAMSTAPPDRESARWIAWRGTLIVMPVFVLALTNPSFYLAAVMKTVALGQQAGETDARNAGRELVGSTLMGALIALAVWLGLSLWPSLWMLMLWLMAAALWAGSAVFGTRRSRFRASFWVNALVTSLILLGPAIEDSASGKSVLQGAVMRVSLFVGVALYAWATVWALERWHARRPRPAVGDVLLEETQ
jgi:hypothetical protein